MFIEGARDPDPAALPRVAEAIAARYGLAADDVVRRMSSGRFRVKSGADRATADALMRDLASVGASCLLVDEAGQVIARTPPGATVSASTSARPSADGADAVMISDRPPPRRESANHGTDPRVRGHQNPRAGLPGNHFGGAAQAHAQDTNATANASAYAMGGGVSLAHSPLDRMRGKLADTPRLRFAVGVLAIVLVGFLPAMVFAQIRAGALAEVDDEVRAEQAQIHDIDAWNRLDEIRASMAERKRSLRSNIAIGGVIIWAVCGAGIGFFWFRRIDWDFYRSASAPPPTPAPVAYPPRA